MVAVCSLLMHSTVSQGCSHSMTVTDCDFRSLRFFIDLSTMLRPGLHMTILRQFNVALLVCGLRSTRTWSDDDLYLHSTTHCSRSNPTGIPLLSGKGVWKENHRNDHPVSTSMPRSTFTPGATRYRISG